MFLNVLIVFLLSGLWHGANWTFVTWGAIHAVFTIFYLLYKKRVSPIFNVPKLIAAAITFLCVSFSWIFFRAASLSDAFLIIRKLFTFNIHSYNTYVVTPDHRPFGSFWVFFSLLTILLLIFNDKIQNVFQNRFHRLATADVVYHSFVLFLVLSFGVFQKQAFIYFQF